MPRPAVPKKGVTVRLPVEVVAYIDGVFYRTGLDRATRVFAGLCAFECCDLSLRSTMIEWATRISEGTATWEDLLAHIEKAKVAALDQRKLQTALEGLLAGEAGEPKRRRVQPR